MSKNVHKFDSKGLDWNLDIAIRYLPIVDEIKNSKIENPSILEVGSGPTGITPYLQLPVTGADVNFGDNVSDLLIPVRVSDTRLPFEDKQFDFVIAVDMLEHIAPAERPNSISEMIRVARYQVFLAVPEGRMSEWLDRVLDRAYEKIHGERYPFLVEHVENGLPRKVELVKVAEEAARQNLRRVNILTKPNANIFARYIWMRCWMSKSRLLNRLYRECGKYYRVFRLFNFPPAYRQIFFIQLGD